MRRAAAALAALVLAPLPALAEESEDEPAEGQPEVLFEIADERIVESSGLAVSAIHDGILYTHNDSGHDANVYAIDEEGSVAAELELGLVEADDWESIASGPDDRIWVGDIGDNDAQRGDITLYRFREPESVEDQSVPWSRFRFEYEDGPHDAEALLVHPETAQVFVVTKTPGGGAVYAGPEELADGSTNELTKVADAPAVVTDGEFLPDGSGIVLRTYTKAFVFDYPSWEARGELPTPLQRQGESVTVSRDGARILVGSEGENSSVYAIPMSALADSVDPATPDPEPSGQGDGGGSNDEADAAAGDRPDGEGIIARVESALGGIPLWIPAAALGIALAAGVAAFPRPLRAGSSKQQASNDPHADGTG